MNNTDYDVAIIGAGPAGSALAILLARLSQTPSRIALFQIEQNTRYDIDVEDDPRVIALNEGSRVLLDSLGAWSDEAATIDTIHVSQSGRLGRTLLKATEMDTPALGYVVRYQTLYTSLLEAARASGVTIHQGVAAQLSNDDTGVLITHEEQQWRSHLGVRADGLRQEVSREAYDQVALVGQATVSLPRHGWAFERFTREGPLALLPHPQNPHLQSIVWCVRPDRAQVLHDMSPITFAQAMQTDFGDRLGTITPQGEFSQFPLYKSFDREPVQGHLVAISNAAQTLHPVAGQGLNLGLRDVETLAHSLRTWLAMPSVQKLDRPLALYQKLRKQDRTLMTSLTDTLSTGFSTGISAVEHLGGLTLLGLDLMPSVRQAFARIFLQGIRA